MKVLFYTSLLRFFLKLDNWLYATISKLVVRNHQGIHPKHDIIKYESWFLDQINSNDRVLDIGSHNGSMSFVLADKAQKVLGIEIMAQNYNKALKNNKKSNVSFMLGDATKISLDEKFNIITLSNVLEHIENRSDFLHRIILQHRPEKILIRVPLITREWLSVYKKNVGINYRLDQTHFTEYTEDQLKQELQSAGLKIESLMVRFGEAFVVTRP